MRLHRDNHQPLPFRKGYKILRKYEREFDDGHGNKATITKLDFKKLSSNKVFLDYTLYVKWK